MVKEILAGESQSFEAIAIDDKGRELAINGGVEWSVLMGLSLAERNMGIKDFQQWGFGVESCYYISDDYSYEDAISIRYQRSKQLMK